MKILLVDDNAFMRDMISNIIDVEDVEIVEAVDGAEAIELFEQSKEWDIRLILMDIIMDKVKGDEAAKSIRSMDRSDAGTVKIYAVTVLGDHNLVGIEKEKVFDGFLTKPIVREELNDVVKNAIK